ncbi:uncharacterized protein P174DRAFT_126130 [Aspergillus novofumigatus IBT 16806]|uniref:Uncharacterized protein n=1 Tax=Aspergillus novofumigatus (strain IBT 16806) TaxID=1392255 RepID=A0A2I1CBU6_ASPN1|nr:uncharacterized protein P174DRAFT_126130 [Aspergillus novofumigatus IBT 16806]PKX95103.1 hypothetical protein P174DRAFT_126130 [Aspergillus novofumigatus IBT 16806]
MWNTCDVTYCYLKPSTTCANTTIHPSSARTFLHPPPSPPSTVTLQLCHQKDDLPRYIKRVRNSSTAKGAQPDPEQDLLGRTKLSTPHSLGQIGSRW